MIPLMAHHRVDLRSQTSSQDQHEPLSATMVEQIAANESNQNTNTIGLVLEQNVESATLQINSPQTGSND